LGASADCGRLEPGKATIDEGRAAQQIERALVTPRA